MAPCRIEPCSLDDVVPLSRNNCCAFWEQPMWRISWPKDADREEMIEKFRRRMNYRLMQDRDVVRHQKAVDPDTGALLGYARWILPRSRVSEGGGGDGYEPEWKEAQIPEISPEELERFKEASNAVEWNARKDMHDLDSKNEAAMKRIMSQRDYLSEFYSLHFLEIKKFSDRAFAPNLKVVLLTHTELDYLAVHPDNQGKGVATALVESGVRAAERMGLPIFVFAFKVARGIYERSGFTELERIIQDDTPFGGTGEYGVYFMVHDVSDPTTTK